MALTVLLAGHDLGMAATRRAGADHGQVADDLLSSRSSWRFAHYSQWAGTSPGPESYYAVRSGQAAAKRVILWPAPSIRAQPARAEPLPVQSIKQPQLDLHSRLHNPGTYRVKAPGRSPSGGRGGRSRQMTPLMADHPSSADDRATRSSVKSRLTPNRRRQSVENGPVRLVHPPRPARLRPASGSR